MKHVKRSLDLPGRCGLGAAIWLLLTQCNYAPAVDGRLFAPHDFPIGVYLQDPIYASRYQALGINLYVGLWKGPTEAQLAALAKAGMPVICEQNDEGLKPRWNKVIVGWSQSDEPDNAQSLKGGGYGPPIAPDEILRRYQRMREADPTRPVALGLGQGVAWDGWHGRGARGGHPEDYPLYVKGCDIAAFDIYPVTHRNPQVAGKLWYVARGVDRLIDWTGGTKPVWADIECTHIASATHKPTPAQVRTEVWMALIHGAGGIVYFVHQFEPKLIEAGLLADPQMCGEITEINRQIHDLSPALDAPAENPGVAIATVPAESDVPLVAATTRRVGRQVYIFGVAMRPTEAQATFILPELAGSAAVEVIGEQRTLSISNGRWEDHFTGYQVHLYRVSL
jgi:hypothetical protein